MSDTPEVLTARGSTAAPAGESQFSDKSHRTRERRNRGCAKSMRRKPTEAEQKLWLLLKDRRFAEYKFRRQVPIGPYIADFVCYSARLIIELDGSQHADGADVSRDEWLGEKGFGVLQLWNNDLTESSDAASDAIWHRLTERRHAAQ